MADNPNVVKRGQLYPIGTEQTMPSGMKRSLTRARWTGEKRRPLAGEWYLSGAIVEAWRAPSDLSMEFHIAKLVTGEVAFG